MWTVKSQLSLNMKKIQLMNKTYKVIATETVEHEVTIEAENFDDACANWHSIAKNKDYKELDREWETNLVEEKSDGRH